MSPAPAVHRAESAYRSPVRTSPALDRFRPVEAETDDGAPRASPGGRTSRGNRPLRRPGYPAACAAAAHSRPSSASAASCSWESLSRLARVFDTHTPNFTTTGSIPLSTTICSLWPRGTDRWPSRSTHCARAARPRWKACCAFLGPFAARPAAGPGNGASAGLIPSVDSLSRCCDGAVIFRGGDCFGLVFRLWEWDSGRLKRLRSGVVGVAGGVFGLVVRGLGLRSGSCVGLILAFS